jgi:hypothetical protein
MHNGGDVDRSEKPWLCVTPAVLRPHSMKRAIFLPEPQHAENETDEQFEYVCECAELQITSDGNPKKQ